MSVLIALELLYLFSFKILFLLNLLSYILKFCVNHGIQVKKIALHALRKAIEDITENDCKENVPITKYYSRRVRLSEVQG